MVVDYDELPVVVTVEEALADDAPRLYDDWPDNKLMDLPVAQPEVDKVFAELDVVRTTFRMQRQSPSPMETRGIVASYQNGRLTVWASAQSPHILRSTLAMMLGLREASIRVIVPNVGGGFGCKLHQYTEDIVVPWLAMRYRPAGPLDRGPGRAPHDLDPRPRAADGRGGGLRQRRAHPGRARHHRHQRRLR